MGSLFRKQYQDSTSPAGDEEPRFVVRRDSATVEFTDGDLMQKSKGIRNRHHRTNSSCLVHDLLEVNKLQEKTLNKNLSEINLTKLGTYQGNGKWGSGTDKKPVSTEPLSKVALSQLVSSVRDLSQSLSEYTS